MSPHGDRLAQNNDAQGAAVCYELAYVLQDSAVGEVRSDLRQRMSNLELTSPATTLLPRGSNWKYSDQGIALPPNWKNPQFDDSSWPVGQAQLGYGGDGEKTTIGTGPHPTLKAMTAYFRTTFHVDQPEQHSRLVFRLLRDDGAIVYLNGREIARDNMPDREVMFVTAAVEGVPGRRRRSLFYVRIE